MATTKAAGQMIYLVENLSDARLRCDQLKRYLAKAMKMIEKSSKRDQFYEVAGDILNGVPDVIFKLDKALDATGLAASRLDYEELKQQLSPEKVDELEEVLEDVRVKHLERRSSPEKDSQVKKAAADLSSEIMKIASGVENASMSPTEAYSRIAGLQGRASSETILVKAPRGESVEVSKANFDKMCKIYLKSLEYVLSGMSSPMASKLLRIWKSIYQKGGQNLTPQETSEFMECYIRGDFD